MAIQLIGCPGIQFLSLFSTPTLSQVIVPKLGECFLCLVLVDSARC